MTYRSPSTIVICIGLVGLVLVCMTLAAGWGMSSMGSDLMGSDLATTVTSSCDSIDQAVSPQADAQPTAIAATLSASSPGSSARPSVGKIVPDASPPDRASSLSPLRI